MNEQQLHNVKREIKLIYLLQEKRIRTQVEWSSFLALNKTGEPENKTDY